VKRLLLALFFVLAVCQPSWAVYTLAQAVPTRGQCGANCTTVSSTFGSTPTTGNVLVAFLLWFDAVNTTAAPAVKDANNVSFTVTPNSPSNARPTTAGIIYCFYLQVPGTPNGAITATFNTTGAAGLATIWVMEFAPSGGTFGGLDMDAVGTGATGVSTNLNTPTVTAAGSHELFVAAALPDHQVTSVDAPWTQVAAGIGNQFAEGIGYILDQSSNQALAMTLNVLSGWDSFGASFIFTPAGGTCTPTLTLMGVGRCG
jgi:hypothetical protein